MELRHVLGKTYYVNTRYADIPFYMIDDKKIILLDSGLPGEPALELIRLLMDYEVAGIIATHAHADHLGANAYYRERGAVIAMPDFEALCIESEENLKAWYNLFSPGEIKELFGGMICKTDILLPPDATEIEICGCKFEIIYTPGHTPGHISVRTPDDVLYLSDALMSGSDCERAKLPYAFSMELDEGTREMLRGVKASAFILAHGGVVGNGIGGAVQNIDTLIEQNAACWRRCFDSVMSFFSEPLTMTQAVKVIIEGLNIKSATNLYGFRIIERNVRSFIDYLADIGRLKPVIRDNQIWYSTAL